MRAIVYTEYGPPGVLRLEEVPKPTVGDDDVLVRVRAASVNPLDWHFMRGTPSVLRLALGLRRPKLPQLGADLAGVVESVGRKVSRFKPGDAVFGSGRGAFAEYVRVRESLLAMKPASVTFEHAAATPVAGLTALQGLRDKGTIRAGQKVLINGAAGGVGTFAVQIARHFGAEVTAVCSTRNLDMVRRIGAHHVIDYTRVNFTRGEARYDLILDAIANHPLSACRRVLTPEGAWIGAGGKGDSTIEVLLESVKAAVLSVLGSRKMVGMIAKRSAADLTVLGSLLEQRHITPVIDRRYDLSEVPEAVRYLEEGHARGKVVITVSAGDAA
jgi:NADPH:quinone reductase-like Zn-dependent oxidoreductase